MSFEHERDFSDFILGDNVYQLANGIIPTIAEHLDVPLSDEPDSSELQTVMQKVGTNKVLRENEEITAMDRETMAGLLEASGVQKALSRSLWTPEITVSADMIDARVALGGVANWTDRAGQVMIDDIDVPTYLLGGTRVMDQPSEKTNPHVERFHDSFGRYPTETQYLAGIVLPKLVAAGKDVLLATYPTGNADILLANFFAEHRELLSKRVSLARNANTGIIMALQARGAARLVSSPAYDSDPAHPQVFVETDEFKVSHTEEDDKNPAEFQKAATGLRQVVLVAKKLHEAAA